MTNEDLSKSLDEILARVARQALEPSAGRPAPAGPVAAAPVVESPAGLADVAGIAVALSAVSGKAAAAAQPDRVGGTAESGRPSRAATAPQARISPLASESPADGLLAPEGPTFRADTRSRMVIFATAGCLVVMALGWGLQKWIVDNRPLSFPAPSAGPPRLAAAPEWVAPVPTAAVGPEATPEVTPEATPGVTPAARPVVGQTPTGQAAADAAFAAVPATRPDTVATAAGQAGAPLPAFTVVAERGDDAAAWVASELAGGSAKFDASTPAAGWEAGLRSLRAQPSFAVARYDALQAALRGPAHARMPALQIVAPLATDPIYFVVRAESPLRFIHDIQGRTINIGAADSARALTARSAYRDMFGQAPIASAGAALGEDDALRRLAAGQGLDVVVIVGATPQSALARLSPEVARGLRLLALDRDDPRSRKVMADFLPVSVAPGSVGDVRVVAGSTLSVMSFLVTAQASAADAAKHAETTRAIAASLCGAMPRMRAAAHGAWTGVAPSLELEVGWPYAAEARAALADCGTSTGARVS